MREVGAGRRQGGGVLGLVGKAVSGIKSPSDHTMQVRTVECAEAKEARRGYHP